MSVRVRFAPSPTGPLHIGGVRTALYNYLFARKNGGQFILRIEDTDQLRYVEGAENYIIEALNWCGLDYDEGPGKGGDFAPYRQSERKPLYRKFADHLLENGNAYIAFDTPQELEEMRERLKTKENPNPQYDNKSRMQMKNSLTLSAADVEKRVREGDPYVIRVKIPPHGEVKFFDIIRGEVSFNAALLDDKVLFKSDGMPTYHLANIVDDHLMKITHVIRGEEWLPSTPLHVLLYKFFGWEKEMPQFAHLPLILKPDGNGKLSKRDGDRLGFPVFPLDWKDPQTGEHSKGFRERGFLPDAFLNMLALLGWNPGTEEEIFSKDELIENFSIERINKAGAKFDFEKAKWFNQQFLKRKHPDELAMLLKNDLEKKGISKDITFLKKICALMVERVTFVEDFYKEGNYFFETPNSYDEKTLSKRWKANSAEMFSKFKDELLRLEDFSSAVIDKFIHDFAEKEKIGLGEILPLFRVMLSGVSQGPAVFEIAEMLGKKEVNRRMEVALEKFPHIASVKTAK